MAGKSIRNPMTTTDIVATIAEQREMTKADVKGVLDDLKDLMQRHLQKGGAGQFNLLGQAKFERVDRKARQARNPQTGETIEIPARRAIKVKPLGGLKNLDL